MAWFEDVVGRFSGGSEFLIGGTPGSGKSRLTTQLGVDLAERGIRTAYILTEENEDCLRERISTLLSNHTGSEIDNVMSNIAVEDSLSSPELLERFVATHILPTGSRLHGTKVLFIDSLMGNLPATSSRRWESVLRALQLLRHGGITSFSVAHVTKSNVIGGPRSLVHHCDCALMLRQLGRFRLLYCLKNRSGRSDLQHPTALALDPIRLSLSPAALAEAQVVTTRTYLAGAGVAEIQVAVSLALTNRPRIIGSHLPVRELEQLIETISKIDGLDVTCDFTVSCLMPGVRGLSSTLGFPLAMALIGSFQQRLVAPHFLFAGQVDLHRKIRDLEDTHAAEIGNAIAAEMIPLPVKIVCSPATAGIIAASSSSAHVVPCRSIDEAMFLTWPETR